ncbi:unnamed protein product [Acanthosepion pharaonis]|uniref:Uncharacterized protein n=1 Tax=Acanthosepion pharaonis TaxID=158019 RepID=A0A812DB85_ACAPH|nr:unnamed protein product [Sepia pharaonis]
MIIYEALASKTTIYKALSRTLIVLFQIKLLQNFYGCKLTWFSYYGSGRYLHSYGLRLITKQRKKINIIFSLLPSLCFFYSVRTSTTLSEHFRYISRSLLSHLSSPYIFITSHFSFLLLYLLFLSFAASLFSSLLFIFSLSLPPLCFTFSLSFSLIYHQSLPSSFYYFSLSFFFLLYHPLSSSLLLYHLFLPLLYHASLSLSPSFLSPLSLPPIYQPSLSSSLLIYHLSHSSPFFITSFSYYPFFITSLYLFFLLLYHLSLSSSAISLPTNIIYYIKHNVTAFISQATLSPLLINGIRRSYLGCVFGIRLFVVVNFRLFSATFFFLCLVYSSSPLTDKSTQCSKLTSFLFYFLLSCSMSIS